MAGVNFADAADRSRAVAMSVWRPAMICNGQSELLSFFCSAPSRPTPHFAFVRSITSGLVVGTLSTLAAVVIWSTAANQRRPDDGSTRGRVRRLSSYNGGQWVDVVNSSAMPSSIINASGFPQVNVAVGRGGLYEFVVDPATTAISR